jgi:hypothetical protein
MVRQKNRAPGLLLVVAIVLGLQMACNKGSDDTKDNDPLFTEDFSNGLVNWTLSHTSAISLDETTGSPTPPSMLIQDVDLPVATATLNVSPFSCAQGLVIWIKAALPPDSSTGQAGMPDQNSVIEITHNGYAVAGVDFVRNRAGATSGTSIIYWINNINNDVSENLGWDSIDGGFIEFMFQVSSNGDALWKRDMVTKFEMTSGSYWPFSTDRSLGIGLVGAQGEPDLPMRFDDIAVYELE